MKTRNIILLIILLVLFDQTIKIVIDNYYFDDYFEVVPALLDFKPMFNAKHSYINALLYKKFQVDLGLWLHLSIFVIIQSIISLFYIVFRQRLSNKRVLLDAAFIFEVSGMICVLMGNLIWKEGCLDYLYLKPFVVFDLKDLYLNCFAVLFLIYTFSNNVSLNELKMKDFINHIKNIFVKEISA